MTAYVTSLYAGLCGVLLIVLAYGVSRQRMRRKVSLGSGGDPAVEQAIRVHGNAAEHMPMGLLLLLLFELNGAPGIAVHAAGAAFLLARIAHAVGLGSRAGVSKGRFYGTLVTWLVMLGLGVAVVVQAALALR